MNYILAFILSLLQPTADGLTTEETACEASDAGQKEENECESQEETQPTLDISNGF